MTSKRVRLPRLLAGVWLGIVGGVPALPAALAWQEKTVELHARSTDEFVDAVFHFTNAGGTPVRIGEIEADCSCTAGTPDKPMYAPGEAGTIVARFTIGDRLGRVRRTLRVATDAADDSAAVLLLDVQVQPMLSVQPRFVAWARDQASEPQVVTVRADAGAGLVLKNLQMPADGFVARLTEEEPAKVWRIEIAPVATGARTSGTFTIETVGPDGRQKNYSFLARVQ